MEYRNARRTATIIVDCEINHPEYGWIPFSCHPGDTGAQFDVAELHSRMIADPATAPYIPPTQEELDVKAAKQVRKQRHRLLATVVDPLVSNPLRWADLTQDQQQAWAAYRMELLNVPQQSGFPQNVIWPVAPQ